MLHAPPSDAFIGRRTELDELGRLLSSGQRLVTLLGPPGMGKTRLALEYLREREHAGSAPEVAVYCALAETRELPSLCTSLAHELGLAWSRRRQRPSQPTADVDALGRALALRGPLLLVLDNFEQLVDTGAEALTRWLRAARELKLLVTSRERLRIEGEIAFELPPLAMPAKDPEHAEASLLFLERARAVEPTFRIDAYNAGTVARLVRKLDGIPLAIELAAARVGVLGLEGLDARLPTGLDVLARGKRGVPARQATMRGAVQWSWDLLDAAEQSALMGCGVFHGGFSLEAAERVLADENSGLSAARVLNLIQALRDKSLIYKPNHAPLGPRFDLYAGIREFVEEQIQGSSAREPVRGRHASFFIAEAERHATDVENTGNHQALVWLTLERSNLLAAFDHEWSVCEKPPHGAGEGALRAATQAVLALEPVLVARGPVEMLEQLIERVRNHPSMQELDVALQARALCARAKTHQLLGSSEAAQRDLEQALALTAGSHEAALSARLLSELGVVHHHKRHAELARACYERALTIYRELGDLRQQARTLGNLGALCHDLTDFSEADLYYERAGELFRRLDEPRWEGIFVTNRGILEQEQGRFERARAHYARAIERLEQTSDSRLLGIALGNLGVLEHECDSLEVAHALHLRAWDVLRGIGDVHSEALCLARLGATYAVLGQPELGRAQLVLAEQILGVWSEPLVSAVVQLSYAFLDLAADDPDGNALKRVRQRIAAAKSTLDQDGRSVVDSSDDVRSTLRILERVLGRTEPLSRLLDRLPSEALVVGPGGSWFRPPRGRLQDLRKYGAVRRILLALVERRQQPGAGELAVEALREAGWPGERVDFHAASNRVHVALADLRKRGLKSWLKRGETGYALDAQLPIEFVELELEA